MLEGITVKVFSGNRKLNPGKDGYLGENLTNLQLKCRIKKKASPNPVCFLVDERKNIIVARNRDTDPNFNLYIKPVPVKRFVGSILTTKPLTNNLRLAIPDWGGKFQLWEIAIVSQDGLFFLTEQMTYQAQFFKNEDGEIGCPYFERPPKEWPQLVEKLKPFMQNKKLLPISKYITPPPINTEGLEKGQAIIEWWNLRLQMGIAKLTRDVSLKVYWRNLTPTNGSLRKLTAGQRVSCNRLPPVADIRPKKSGFSPEIFEVTPL